MNQNPRAFDDAIGTDLSSVILGVRGVSKRFGHTQALDDVTVSMRRGEALALIGANGAGKSTLVRVFTGAVMPDSGEVIVDGKVVNLRSVREARAHGIGYIPQELTVAPDLTVAENVLAGGWSGQRGLVRTRQSHDLVKAACSRVGLTLPMNTLLARLSPAEQRLLMIARGLVMQPSTLILDEPTAALADREATRIVDVLNQLRGDELSIVYISHRMGEISRLCDSIAVLRDGRLLMRGPATLESVEHAVSVGVAGGVRTSEPRASVSASVKKAADDIGGDGPALALSAIDLTNKRLRGATIKVRVGEIVGIAGLLGSGRTEFLRALAGADHISSGRIELFGETVHFRSPASAIAAGVALIPEDRRNQGGLLSLSIRDNIVLPSIPSRRGGWVRKRDERAAAEAAIARFGVKCSSPNALMSTLSGGNQQKVIIARWLLNDARLLLLDEPTAGIDVVAKAEILRLVRTAVDEGRAAVVVSSELSELCGYCDRIYVMRSGVICEVVDGNISVEELARRCGTRKVESAA